jgi:hypothetical protein
VPETAVHTTWTLKYDMKYVKMYRDKIVKNASMLYAINGTTYLQKTVYVWDSITAAINITEDLFSFPYLMLIL